MTVPDYFGRHCTDPVFDSLLVARERNLQPQPHKDLQQQHWTGLNSYPYYGSRAHVVVILA